MLECAIDGREGDAALLAGRAEFIGATRSVAGAGLRLQLLLLLAVQLLAVCLRPELFGEQHVRVELLELLLEVQVVFVRLLDLLEHLQPNDTAALPHCLTAYWAAPSILSTGLLNGTPPLPLPSPSPTHQPFHPLYCSTPDPHPPVTPLVTHHKSSSWVWGYFGRQKIFTFI